MNPERDPERDTSREDLSARGDLVIGEPGFRDTVAPDQEDEVYPAPVNATTPDPVTDTVPATVPDSAADVDKSGSDQGCRRQDAGLGRS